jgi:hypothetical protein
VGVLVLSALAGLGVVLAVAGLIVALQANSRTSDLSDELDAAKTELAATEAQVEATKSVDLTGINKNLKTVKGQMKHVLYCLPELTSHIDGMQVQTGDNQGYVTFAYLTNGDNISRFCSDVLKTKPQSNTGD